MMPFRNLFIVYISLFIALVLTLLPMPSWFGWLRPHWILLVLIYWAMTQPYQVNVGTAWVVGIILDVLTGTLLGEHALGLTVITYFVVRFQSRLQMFPLLQQGLCVFLLVVLYQAILFSVQGFLGDAPKTMLYWLASITSVLIWPWLFVVLQDFRRKAMSH
ncbi:hypothetical protein AYO45_00790 [Gammaproteobacteria bacterium SCGC AG-212-F23]|nr:hypothetical protein AYO45_00790 [Gammaproteobacteria bacterium SCGC AG-212-F23]